MKILSGTQQLFKSAFADFRRDKVRTALTSLGIMIGVLSVVLLIALGLGLKNYIEGQFESLGANLLMVLPGSGFTGEGGGGFGGQGIVGGAQFDEKDVRDLSRLSGIKYLTPVVFKSSLVQANGEEKAGYVMGANEDFFGLMSYKILSGDLWGKTEVGNRSKVAVLGYNLADDLFDKPADGLGKTLRVSGIRLKVVGVIKKTGDNEQDRSVVIPYTTTFGSLNPSKTFFSIYLGVESKDEVEAVSSAAEKILLRRYDEDEFAMTELSEILSTVNSIFGIINVVLMAIGSISLIVGGIGIMNIMYATVTERTREVGIRRAIGATKRDILLQFMTESVLLSFLGGAVGLLLAAGIVLLVRIWFPVALNLTAVLVAFGVSSAIGIFFGVFPAKKAADLSPIEAIRYE
ncbi:MAG: Macrolide export ATP-binding/permease protein MacB [Candidatus Collierbacteria bacterium GW2011_GWB1_44_6]|uniref:Macrolide export ATP-binding/permease protein MacB n=2 Tax=Candidatus Collieribacteriota TaxID=1752725 RepID=A0A0G1JLA0_9BACT|nr:MAG: Macrolide export ATP-binding/permease protein MacB [Candidatus Collierbacteria bacterium GW2011_GWC2_43_12]KKT72130.1 MAG: Macrolide export ATP-binding/permease protein MacB [Candidatus Collierbacteria bacterium GW2011_GWB1_44_6]KKT82597.1 MAG: hypothetical protein UW80_C0034G0004 [Microgenomates group bacterium GW2011_GWC1_44_9]